MFLSPSRLVVPIFGVLLLSLVVPGRVAAATNVLSESRSVEAFRRVSIEGPVDLYLTKELKHSVIVTAEEDVLPRIITRVDKEVLHVRVNAADFSNLVGKPIQARVSAVGLRGLTFAGSGTAESVSLLQCQVFDLVVSGRGNAKLAINCDELRTVVSGTGNLRLTGEASRHWLQISGSGSVAALGLHVDDYKVLMTGSGNAEIAVSGTLKIKSSGTGSIFYRGHPDVVRVQVSGNANVRSLNSNGN